jgi:hypothetical protein
MSLSGAVEVSVENLAPAPFITYDNNLKPGHSVLEVLGFRVLAMGTTYFIV